jgi:hypothetical protein
MKEQSMKLIHARGPVLRVAAEPEGEIRTPNGPLISVRHPLIRLEAEPDTRPSLQLFLTIRDGVDVETVAEHLLPLFGLIKHFGYSWQCTYAKNGRLEYWLTGQAETSAQAVREFSAMLGPVVQVIQNVQTVEVSVAIAA